MDLLKLSTHLRKVIKLIATFAKNRNEMTVEREFAGFVLPFTAGVFLATGPALIRTAHFPALCTASLAVTAMLLMCLMHPYRRSIPAWIPWILLIMTGLSTGAFSGLTSSMASVSSLDSSFMARVTGFGSGLGEAIDRVKFGSPTTNALLKALVTGERGDIPRSVAEAFRLSGASHILSLSGFHLGIIYGIIKCSLAGLGNSTGISRLRSVLIIFSCGFYTLATGAGPSIVRAFLFIMLGETVSMLRRHRSTSGLLFSALFIQSVFSPASIRSVSFQLSYAAMAGIAYIYPWLRNFWPGNPDDDRLFTKGVRWIWNSAAMSIACQITTGPLAYLYFKSFPVHFLLTNLIALPLTSILIPVGLASIALSALGICPPIMLKATDLLAEALSAALEIISGM